MRTIYLRHADKDFQNGCSDHFKHDPGITEIGVERAKIIGQKLLELYGEPDEIVSSPYRRTRETALILNNLLPKPLDISIDTKVSEYLGNHNNFPLDVTYSTAIHNPPHPESFEQMKKRVREHVEKNRRKSSKNPDKLIWVVTHGLIIRQIADLFEIKSSKQLPYLTCFSLIEKEDLVRGEFLLFKTMTDENYRKKSVTKFYQGRDDISGRFDFSKLFDK